MRGCSMRDLIVPDVLLLLGLAHGALTRLFLPKFDFANRPWQGTGSRGHRGWTGRESRRWPRALPRGHRSPRPGLISKGGGRGWEMQQYQGNKECFLKSAADQKSSLLAYISSNPYTLNRKTDTKAVIPSQPCGNCPREDWDEAALAVHAQLHPRAAPCIQTRPVRAPPPLQCNSGERQPYPCR